MFTAHILCTSPLQTSQQPGSAAQLSHCFDVEDTDVHPLWPTPFPFLQRSMVSVKRFKVLTETEAALFFFFFDILLPLYTRSQ